MITLLPSIRHLCVVVALFGACVLALGAQPPSFAPPAPADDAALRQLDNKYERIRAFIGEEMYGPGGPIVLEVAYRALREKHAAGEGLLVGLEDLWAHALQEGLVLFNRPELRWGRTTAEETSDMIGQTTIGPWQMTVWNVRENYGPHYGVEPEWTDAQIYVFCREHPEVQAKMITDYIQLSYESFGRRGPYSIQRYFWLDPFVKGEIGQSEDWTRSPVAKPPAGGTWTDLTPAMKADTGFYAKQVLLGTSYTDTGLLFWLWVTGDTEAIRDTLRTWRDEKRMAVAGDDDAPRGIAVAGSRYERTEEPGGFAIAPEDVIYYDGHPDIQEGIRELVREIAQEKRMEQEARQ